MQKFYANNKKITEIIPSQYNYYRLQVFRYTLLKEAEKLNKKCDKNTKKCKQNDTCSLSKIIKDSPKGTKRKQQQKKENLFLEKKSSQK